MANKRNGLTQNMESFCQEYVRTNNATEAYLHSYNTANRGLARRRGSELLQRDDITERIKELNQPTVNKIMNEREKKRQILWDRIERSIEKEDEPAIARYMDILNKMDSEYVNINRNIEHGGEKLAGLMTEQLKNLLDS
jgi:phage terminase small subunit